MRGKESKTFQNVQLNGDTICPLFQKYFLPFKPKECTTRRGRKREGEREGNVVTFVMTCSKFFRIQKIDDEKDASNVRSSSSSAIFSPLSLSLLNTETSELEEKALVILSLSLLERTKEEKEGRFFFLSRGFQNSALITLYQKSN